MALLKKLIWLPTILVPLLILFGLSVSYGQEEIFLDNPDGYPKKQRSGVVFPHEFHMGEFDCLDCHHDYDNGENVLDESELEEGNTGLMCISCHDDGSKVDLKQAFHRQCVVCHMQLRKAKQPTGPELCGECHRK